MMRSRRLVLALVLSVLLSLSLPRSCLAKDKQKNDSSGGGGVPLVAITSMKALEGRKNLWLIRLDSNPQQNLPTDLIHLASLVEGLYKVGIVDTSTENGMEIAKQLLPAKYNSKKQPSFPMQVIFSDGFSQVVADGSLQGMANALVAASTEIMQSRASRMGAAGGGSSSSSQEQSKAQEDSLVIQLNAGNFDELVYQSTAASLIAFTAPWCGHCRKLQPEWDQASTILGKQVGVDVAFLGWVDATVDTQLASDYQVRGYPTIYFLPPGAKSSADGILYQGERSASSLAQYALQQLEKYGGLTIPQLLSTKDLQTKCGGTNHLCILTVLPHLADTSVEARNNHLALIQTVAEKFPSVSFLWSEGTVQPDLEQSFGLTFGYPAVVAYTMDRAAFAVMHGSFSEKSLTMFLHSITTGRIATQPIATPPKVETVPKWDGKPWEGVPEDEFSLEDIMGDEF